MLKKELMKWKFVILIVCCLLIGSIAFDLLFLRFVPVVPLMIIALYTANKISYKWVVGVLFYSAAIIFFNMTLAKNSLFFPISNGGQITVNKDGYCVVYGDGSKGYIKKEDKESVLESFPKTVFTPVYKGQVLEVTRIVPLSGLASWSISLETKAGYFGEYNEEYGDISVNKKIQAYPYLKHLSQPLYMISFGIAIPFVVIFSAIYFTITES